jgi:hypothetical protein
MVNFRVRDFDAMTAQLRAAGIAVAVDSAYYPNGRFARLHDRKEIRLSYDSRRVATPLGEPQKFVLAAIYVRRTSNSASQY